MPEVKRPRRGSLAYYPRKRAKRIYPAISTYPETEKTKVLGFAGYKAGMTNAILIDNRKGSPTFGQEISVPVTVLDCPPLKVLGVRAYEKTAKGLRVLCESWIKDLPKDITRKVKIVPKENLAKIENSLDKISNLRLIVSTQPRLSGIGKKKPEIFETEVGGKNSKEKFEFAKSLLGKEIAAKDVTREGELVDVIAVTKGKGFAGPVKRFGVKIQVRHAKKKLRHVGTLGPETPARVLWSVPMAGQLGFQRRTELNKRVLKIGEKGEEITPKGGFTRYGIIKSNYILLEGSVPGAKKRLIFLRPAIRPSKVKLLIPEIKEIIK
ncbi:MAG: 50S ribosomal protein L3 [Candidatus Aenigmarchaeota archaeon]|nr:50S ribosomal protein L3 [Candidatus Aenigmarchaeota archaeon]